MMLFVLLFWTSSICVSSADEPVVEMENSNNEWSPLNTMRFDDTSTPNTRVSTGVVWENCNTSRVSIYLRGLNVVPYPLPLGKRWALTYFVLEIKEDIGVLNKPVEIALSLQMFVQGRWIELCEWMRNTHCYIPDMCDEFENLFKNYCPQVLVEEGSNCTCPITSKIYNITNLPIQEHIDLPFKIEGIFKATAVLRAGGRDVGCIKVKFCIHRCVS